MYCEECNTKIEDLLFSQTKKLYRCCDANVCSKVCSLRRLSNIKNIDPELNSPMSWPSMDMSRIPETDILDIEQHFTKLRRRATFSILDSNYQDDLVIDIKPLESNEDTGDNETEHSCVVYNISDDDIETSNQPGNNDRTSIPNNAREIMKDESMISLNELDEDYFDNIPLIKRFRCFMLWLFIDLIYPFFLLDY